MPKKTNMEHAKSIRQTDTEAVGTIIRGKYIFLTIPSLATKPLLALVKDTAGSQRSLSQLEQAAARITEFYRSHGYLVTRAYIPAQDLQDGIVEIAVLEGRYGALVLENQSRTRDVILRRYLGSAQVGTVINEQRLERALLLLQDSVQGARAGGGHSYSGSSHSSYSGGSSHYSGSSSYGGSRGIGAGDLYLAWVILHPMVGVPLTLFFVYLLLVLNKNQSFSTGSSAHDGGQLASRKAPLTGSGAMAAPRCLPTLNWPCNVTSPRMK